MINLFEYQNKQEFKGSFDNLETFLDDIWMKRERSQFFSEDETDRIEAQRFIQFIHKTQELKSNKYVWVIHFEWQKINLLPKIFYDWDREYSPLETTSMQNHILWWLSYCKKIKFPNYQTSLDSTQSDFFEILIYLFSKYTRELLSHTIYQQYEEVNEELSFMKGRLNIDAYITENAAKWNWHKMNCTYDAFVIDNAFNRIIKYVTSLLFNATSSQENKRYLREILFILDEVSDVRAKAEDCLWIQFNPLFGSFETVRDYCYLFLSNSISLDYKNNLKLFAFLLPMEYVFEDFVFWFIEKELPDVVAKNQDTSTHLDTEKNFSIRPDLILDLASKRVIADTKYKIIYSDEKDPKRGISQSDLYQMMAYAIRYNVSDIKLFYPDTVKQYQERETAITVRDELANGRDISITAYQLPIIQRELHTRGHTKRLLLSEIFEGTKNTLIGRLKNILK